MKTQPELNSREFSLVLGGPLFQLLRKNHLAGDALQLLRRRILFFILITWLPLWILSSLAGEPTNVPFVRDLEAHVRFLVALPLFIAAELHVHQRMRGLIQRFLERDPTGLDLRAQPAASVFSRGGAQ